MKSTPRSRTARTVTAPRFVASRQNTTREQPHNLVPCRARTARRCSRRGPVGVHTGHVAAVPRQAPRAAAQRRGVGASGGLLTDQPATPATSGVAARSGAASCIRRESSSAFAGGGSEVPVRDAPEHPHRTFQRSMHRARHIGIGGVRPNWWRLKEALTPGRAALSAAEPRPRITGCVRRRWLVQSPGAGSRRCLRRSCRSSRRGASVRRGSRVRSRSRRGSGSPPR